MDWSVADGGGARSEARQQNGGCKCENVKCEAGRVTGPSKAMTTLKYYLITLSGAI